MSPTAPVVSIIMPCYNAAAHLPRSVGSVLAQTFSDWELIAVDDGSNDGTLAWLRSQDVVRLRVLGQANQGVSAARNAGLELARGDYLAFLDADDTWKEDFIEKLVAALSKRPDAVLAYCGWQNLGLPDRRCEPFIPPDYENASKAETLFAGCRWPIHAVLVKRDAVIKAGGFDSTLSNAEDFALWLRVAIAAPIIRVPEVLAYYHFHGFGQASANRARAALQLLYAQQKFLAEYPDFSTLVGPDRIRELTLGELLQRGYAFYWQRDLPAARTVFRAVMKQGHGTFTDWLRMLPAWLPLSMHQWLVRKRDQHSRNLSP